MHEAGVNGAQYTDVSRCEEMHGYWIVHQPCHRCAKHTEYGK